MMEVIALGRQSAWSGPLNKWLCEPGNRPPIPTVLDSFAAAGVFEWLLAIGIPSFLCLAFLSTSKSRNSLLIWLPVLALHLAIRVDALGESFRPWGACGLHRDGVFGALLLDILLVVVTVFGSVIWIAWGVIATQRRKNA
ncbi:hypothetical protein NP590_13205 [Methylomonas sp. SURF-2]|uniref:Uncharacterized protein n=1 Tax=Methylomonas subterranea TaxID=2952225 RepID=A0ABT1THZ1_9GAMM|nr:hypothetical protein [Methylomonas sp. SURF-2]MCQ8105068.1 hypothetical protein [Methylomonas sp. SURF-2]